MPNSSEHKKCFIFDWKIENFSFYPRKNTQPLDSPKFYMECMKKTGWYIKLYPREKINSEFASCELKSISGNEQIFLIDIEIELIGTGRNISKTKKVKNVKSSNGAWKFQKLYKIEDIFRPSSEYLPQDTLMLQCRIWSDLFKNNSHCCGYTKIGIDRSIVKRKIEQFSTKDNWSFDILFPNQCNFHFTVEKLPTPNHVVININDLSLYPSVLLCKVSLLDRKGLQFKSKRIKHFFEGNKESLKFPNFIQKNISSLKKEKCMVKDSFVLRFELAISNGINCTYLEEPSYNLFPKQRTPNSPLLKNIQNMYVSKSRVDVKLVAGNQIFPAHKLILSERSPVFAKILQQKQNEMLIDVPYMDPNILDDLLKFMYGFEDLLNLDCERAMCLMKAANKYQIKEVEQKCSTFLQTNLSENNVCDVLLLSDEMCDVKLKTQAENYFMPCIKRLILSSGWKQLVEKNIKIAIEILSKFVRESEINC